MTNPFDLLKPIEKNIFIKGLNSTIIVRELSLGEIKSCSKQEDVDDIAYAYVSASLVSPKMGVKDLKKLGSKAMPVISEIITHILPKLGNLPASKDSSTS